MLFANVSQRVFWLVLSFYCFGANSQVKIILRNNTFLKKEITKCYRLNSINAKPPQKGTVKSQSKLSREHLRKHSMIRRLDNLKKYEFVNHLLCGPQREKTFLQGLVNNKGADQTCASTQSDQRLCYSLLRKYHIFTCYEGSFNFLASLCSWAGWFEAHFVGNPEARFSRVAAHMLPPSPMELIDMNFIPILFIIQR